ncbi:MAG: hypothetical protein N5P05_003797 [Chroococcopsis gigantea SAG 12.99]|jgi:glycosyltransferase involved in cell wall biosynthesis|nr:glycosyltransferase [Chlorogloea purpurea SAG 13.99]MDV3002191.1 hypothetical protein [Chroococcopsis gigantea SAG 12.99]
MSIPVVSVIVPVYNGEKTIQACIESILQSNYPRRDFELIVVNNASTDKTGSILERYRDTIVILYESKRGPSAARNKGIKNAKGEYIALTDADCFVDYNWLSNIVLPLHDREIGIVGGQNLSKNPHNKIELFGEMIHDHFQAINVYKPPYVITMNWASRSSVLKEYNFFDENLLRCEDVDLAFRIFQAGYKFFYQPKAIVSHHNEENFLGLFKEGFSHGFYSPLIYQKHEKFLQEYSKLLELHDSIYQRIYRNFLLCFSNGDKINSWCAVVFDCGKIIGNIFGRYLNVYDNT